MKANLPDIPDEELAKLPPIDELRKKTYQQKRGDRVKMILAMRASGMKYAEIAKHFNSNAVAIGHVVLRQRNKLRELDDPQYVLDKKCKSKAVRNLDRILDNEKHEHHFRATEITLFGTGMLKRHINTKTEGGANGQLPSLTVNVVNAPLAPRDAPRELPDIAVAAVGTPREL